MLTIELEPELEMSLNAMAKEQHLAVEELVKQFIKQCMPKQQESVLLVDVLKSLPKIACFEGKDPLALQQEWRDTKKRRSESIAKSWKNLETRKKRQTRHTVTVDNIEGEFKSLREAFKYLGLPDSKHIEFRAALKKEGTKTFSHKTKDGNLKEYTFRCYLRESGSKAKTVTSN